MLPDDLLIGEVWHPPNQKGKLGSGITRSVLCEGARRGWYMGRVAARSWKRCASEEEAIAARKQYGIDARYNATYEELEGIRRHAGGACRICLKVKPLCIDHCHDTGLIRGLLCINCNTSIGKFDDSPERLRRAADYLDFYRSKHRTMISTKPAL